MQRIKTGLTSFQLKVIGIIFMVFDHIHQMFYYHGVPMGFTMVGRIVAPIFLFLSTEGYTHTRNKRRYMTTLLVGYWICQVLFNLTQRILPNDQVVLLNSIFGTLFLGLVTMWIWDQFTGEVKNIKAGLLGLVAMVVLTVLPLVLLSFTTAPWGVGLLLLIPSPLLVEGSIVMIMMALMMYIFRKHRWAQCLVIIAVSVLQYFSNPADVQWMMVFSVIPIYLYNGQQGRKEKWFFYIFYPVHIIVLYVISTLMG